MPSLTLPSCDTNTYHHQHLSPPQSPSSSSLCLIVRLLLVMKSSEQVFNNRRISNYHATVTGMHTSVFSPLSLSFSLWISCSHCAAVSASHCFTPYSIITFVFHLKAKSAAVLQHFLEHHFFFSTYGRVLYTSVSPTKLHCWMVKDESALQPGLIWLFIFLFLLIISNAYNKIKLETLLLQSPMSK